MKYRWYVPLNGATKGSLHSGTHRTFGGAVRGMVRAMRKSRHWNGRIYSVEGNPGRVTGMVAKINLEGMK